MKKIRRQVTLLVITISLVFILCNVVSAADLNLTKGSWDTVGLDSNNVNVGPNEYNVQVHVTNNGSDPATNVQSTFTWASSNSNIELAPGETATKQLGTINPGQTVDVFYLIRVNRTSAAYDTLRNYTISVSSDNAPARIINGSLYVEKLISQSRNYVDSITVSNPSPSLGQTFAVTVNSRTASATYNVVNFPLQYDPTKVQPLSYTVTYTNSGGTQTSNNIMITSPGTTVFTSVWIFQAIGAGNAPFYGIITDQSGQSFHYNDDFGVANITTNVTPKADLAITKTANQTTNLHPGDKVTFTLTVTNYGPNTAHNVVVTDLVPTGISFFSAATPSQGTWNPSTGIWNVGTLAVGESATLLFNATIGTFSGQIFNIANVTGNETDPDLTNNQDMVILNATKLYADILIQKTVDNTTPCMGDIITYKITVTNAGPDTAENVSVTDTWSNYLNLISANPSQGSFNATSHIWTIGSLTHGASVTLTILANALQTGLISNTATVTSTTEDPNTENNNSTATINVEPCIDLDVTKAVDNPNPKVGQNVVYTITVTNNGPNNATGVKLVDLLPAGLIFVSATNSGSWDNSTNTITWNIGDLAVNQTMVFYVTAKVNKSGNLTNTAIATGNEYDHDETNNEDTVTINGEPSADLKLIKESSTVMPNNGDTVQFTIKLRNNGPSDAYDVFVTDPWPNGLVYVTGSAILSQGTFDEITGTWNVGFLPHNVEATLVFLAKVTQTGFITNIATANSTTYDPMPEDNTDSVTLDVQPSADLAVTKTQSTPTQTSVQYTITVTNNGPDNATGVRVNDLIPAELTYIGSSATQGTYDNQTGIWYIGNLANGASVTLTINAAVPLGTNTYINIATVTGNENDPNLLNNQDTTQLNGEAAADLTITKTVDNPKPKFGNYVHFTITVHNAGPDDAGDVVVTDIWPTGLIYVNSSSPITFNSNIFTWTVGTLLHGQSASLNITAIVNALGQITNFVNVTSNVTDPHLDDNNATVTVEGQPVADIAVNKTVSPNPQNYGQNVIHTITVTNNGPNDATGVILRDVLQSGTELIFQSIGSISKGTFNPIIGEWNIGNLANGTMATLSLIFKVNATGTINNTAVKTHQDQFDPDTTNDSSNATLQVPSAADLSITKTVSNPRPYLHEVITSTLIVQNHGPNTATGVYVVDELPDGLKYISSSANYGSYDPLTGIWTIGDLPNGAIAILNIRTAVEKIGPLENHAHVYSSTYDPILNNQAATASVDVQATPVNAATVPMQPTGLPVGYLAIAVLLVLAGILTPKRKE